MSEPLPFSHFIFEIEYGALVFCIFTLCTPLLESCLIAFDEVCPRCQRILTQGDLFCVLFVGPLNLSISISNNSYYAIHRTNVSTSVAASLLCMFLSLYVLFHLTVVLLVYILGGGPTSLLFCISVWLVSYLG